MATKDAKATHLGEKLRKNRQGAIQSGSLLESSEVVGYAEDQQHGSFHADAVDGSM